MTNRISVYRMIIASFTLLFLNMVCKHATEPPPPNGPDTTSHSFVWQTDTLGGAASSTFHDVAIINDTLAYAVGNLYFNDSSGQIDPQPFNLAEWNGLKWNAKKLAYFFQGQAYYGPIYSVFALSASDIWFGIGNMIHWNGQAFSSIELPAGAWGPYRIHKIWGNGAVMYIAGEGGSISAYNQGIWQKLSTGTALDIYDIYGNGSEILAIASQLFVSFDHKILRINNSTTASIPDSEIVEAQHGIWTASTQVHYVVGNGIYFKADITSQTPWQRLDGGVTRYFLYAIRGNAANDIFACGSFGEVLHYNGATWKSYRSVTALSNGGYNAIAVKGNTVICVGDNNGKALILRGTRIQ